MLKNLGWARLKQKRYAEAEASLRQAITLGSDEAAAHCLLAQVLEVKGNKNGAVDEWENCLRYASSYNPDEDAWIGLARQRINIKR